MKRLTGIATAIVLMSLTLAVDSAKAQYYRPSRGGNIGAGIAAGIVVGVIAGIALSSATRGAMQDAELRVYDEDVEDGYRSEFQGDGHRGYYEVVNQGYHRSYATCRQVRTVVYNSYGEPVEGYSRRPPRSVCLNPRSNEWVAVNADEYYIRVSRPVARRPYGSEYERPPIALRPVQTGPMYRPYPGPGQQIPIARPYPVRPSAPYYAGPPVGSGAPMIAGPARPMPQPQFQRPSNPYAPPVLPATPQAIR